MTPRRRGRGPRRARHHPLRWRLEFGVAWLATAFLRALPERLARGLGALLGHLAPHVVRRRALLVRENLRLVHPDWSEAQREAVLRANFVELGRCMAEWARLPDLQGQALRERVELEGLEHLQAVLARGRGALVVTAHYGLWELIPAAVRAHLPGLDVAAVGRTLRNPYLFDLILRRRAAGGGDLLPQDARAILRALRRGAAIGMLVDQYTSERRTGVLVPFLGLRAWTNAGPATLALRTGAPLLPVCVRRRAGARHVIVFGPEIPPPASGELRADVLELTARINRAVGAFIQQDPVPWLWSHRRYRRSPDAPPGVYGEHSPVAAG
jgi:KDO2-lipid IV(A) lauroyltransferase